jgi:hypothetical protein
MKAQTAITSNATGFARREICSAPETYPTYTIIKLRHGISPCRSINSKLRLEAWSTLYEIVKGIAKHISKNPIIRIPLFPDLLKRATLNKFGKTKFVAPIRAKMKMIIMSDKR